MVSELLHELDLVQVEQERDAVFPHEVSHRLDDLGCPEEIEVGDELVSEDHPGSLEERARNGHPLPLPAAQPEHLLVRLVRDAQEVQVVHCPLDLMLWEEAQHGQDAWIPPQGSQEDVLKRCEPTDQAELLGDVADLLSELRRDPPMIKGMPQDFYLPALGRKKPCQDLDQGGLPRAGGPKDHPEAPAGDLQGDPPEHPPCIGWGPIGEPEIACPDCRRRDHPNHRFTAAR